MSALLALIANCHRDPKKMRAFKSADFDPFAPRPMPVPVDMNEVKRFFGVESDNATEQKA